MRGILYDLFMWCVVTMVALGVAGGLLFLAAMVGLFPS